MMSASGTSRERKPALCETLPPIERPGVSFVTPVYNKAHVLSAMLRALHSQTGDFDREFIFVDDGSTDGSSEILREETQDWANTRVVTQLNRGQAAAANRGVGLATMPYVKYMDADDLLAPNAVRTLLDAIHGTDACAVYGAGEPFDEVTNVHLSLIDPVGMTVNRVEDAVQKIIRSGIFNPSQALIRRDCIRAVGGSDERIIHGQEYSLSLRLAHHWPILNVDRRVAYILTTGADRLTADRGGQQWRVTMAIAYFLEEHPDVEYPTVLMACQRSAKRAVLFCRRRHGGRGLSQWAWMVLRTYLPIRIADPVQFIKKCATVFGVHAR